MGGEYQGHKGIRGTKADVQSRFNAIREEDAWDRGHGGYTGTFAEKPDIQIIPKPGGGYWSEAEAEEHCVENNGKWGEAFAYETGKDKWYFGGWCSS